MNNDTLKIIEEKIYKSAESSAATIHQEVLQYVLSTKWEGRHCNVDIVFYRKGMRVQSPNKVMDMIKSGKIVADDVRTICIALPEFKQLFQQAPLSITSWAELRAEISRLVRDQLIAWFVELHSQQILNSINLEKAVA